MACANLGWTADEVLDQMTFELWSAFLEEWKLRPPAHWLAAAYLRYEPPKPPQHMDAAAAAEFMRLTGGKIPGVA